MYECKLKQICEAKGIKEITELQLLTGLSRPLLHRMWDNDNIGNISLRKFEVVSNKLDICIFKLIDFGKVDYTD